MEATTRRDALEERLFGAVLGTMDLHAAYLRPGIPRLAGLGV